MSEERARFNLVRWLQGKGIDPHGALALITAHDRAVKDAYAHELAEKQRQYIREAVLAGKSRATLLLSELPDLIDPEALAAKLTKLEMFMAAEGSTSDELCACDHTRAEHSVNGRQCRRCLCGGGFAGTHIRAEAEASECANCGHFRRAHSTSGAACLIWRCLCPGFGLGASGADR